MGNCIPRIYSRSLKVLMVGLDEAGKTTILNKIKCDEYMPTIPTYGFNVEVVEFKNLKYIFWDLGGNKKVCFYPCWHLLY